MEDLMVYFATLWKFYFWRHLIVVGRVALGHKKWTRVHIFWWETVTISVRLRSCMWKADKMQKMMSMLLMLVTLVLLLSFSQETVICNSCSTSYTSNCGDPFNAAGISTCVGDVCFKGKLVTDGWLTVVRFDIGLLHFLYWHDFLSFSLPRGEPMHRLGSEWAGRLIIRPAKFTLHIGKFSAQNALNLGF